MSSHDQVRADLPAYVARRLKGVDLQRFEEHLEECDDCGRMAAAWNDMAAVVRDSGDALFEPHPGEAELRQLAGGEAGEASERLRRHLDLCASCELEARMWERRHAFTGTSGAPARWRSALAVASLSAAAGILLGIGIVTLWRSWGGPARTTEVEQSSWAGPTVLILLPRPLRGETAPLVTHRIEKEEKRVVIAFPLVESHVKEGDGPYSFEIVGAASGPVLTRMLTRSAILRHLEAATVVTIDVPADQLVPDRYEFRVVGPGGSVLYRASMEILPAD